MSSHSDMSALHHSQKDILTAIEKNNRALKWILLVVIVILVISIINFVIAFST